jgi:hypothetical protein
MLATIEIARHAGARSALNKLCPLQRRRQLHALQFQFCGDAGASTHLVGTRTPGGVTLGHIGWAATQPSVTQPCSAALTSWLCLRSVFKVKAHVKVKDGCVALHEFQRKVSVALPWPISACHWLLARSRWA